MKKYLFQLEFDNPMLDELGFDGRGDLEDALKEFLRESEIIGGVVAAGSGRGRTDLQIEIDTIDVRATARRICAFLQGLGFGAGTRFEQRLPEREAYDIPTGNAPAI